MKLYLDESGDLGWNFNNPYRSGGSSRYLNIASVLVPGHLTHLPRRIVKKLYDKRKRTHKKELKSTDLNPPEKVFVVDRTIQLLKASLKSHNS